MALKKIDIRIPTTLTLDDLTDSQVITLRAAIDQRLNLSLDSIDMKQELALQLRNAQSLYAEAADSSEIPANQKAQILNTISSILKSVTDIAETIHTIEKHKKIEVATLAAVKDLPTDAKDKFFDILKGLLDE